MFKVCKICDQTKDLTEFYCYKGNYRGECKKCKTKGNVARNKFRTTLLGESDKDLKRKYSRDYYAAHKEEFAEYRKTFNEKHPDYHRTYARNKKNVSHKTDVPTRQSFNYTNI